jgi:hypothetical protein
MSATHNPLGRDPGLDEVPDFKVFMSDIIQDYMLEVRAADGSITRPARTEEQVIEELTQKWQVGHSARVADYKQRKKAMEEHMAAAQAKQAKDDANAAADAAAELQRLADKDLKKLPRVPDITKAGLIPDRPTVCPCAYATGRVQSGKPVKPQYFAEAVIRAQYAAGTHGSDGEKLNLGEGVTITLDGSSTNKSGIEKRKLSWADWVGLTNIFASVCLAAGYSKSYCKAWVGLPLKLSHWPEYFNHPVYENLPVLIYLSQVWDECWDMIAGYSANPNYRTFNPGAVSEARLKQILEKIMKDETLG